MISVLSKEKEAESMLFEKEAIIHYESGVHARVAAMIVQKSH